MIMIMDHPIKFGWKKISSSVDMVETVISDHMGPQCDLEDSSSISCITLYLMMMHHHTNFGYIRFSSWEYIVKMNNHRNFEPFLCH